MSGRSSKSITFFDSSRVSLRPPLGTTRTMSDEQTLPKDDNDHIDSEAMNSDALDSGAMDDQPDGDRQLVTESDALDEGGTNDSDLGADVAGDIGPKHA